MAWQNAQTILQIKWSSTCNELHIDEKPHDLFSSLSFMYPTLLNVINHGKRRSIWKLTILASLNEAGDNLQQFQKNPHMHIMNLVLFCPKPYFSIVKHAK